MKGVPASDAVGGFRGAKPPENIGGGGSESGLEVIKRAEHVAANASYLPCPPGDFPL